MDGQDYLKQIQALKHLLAQLPPLSKDTRDNLWRYFRLGWNYHSNRLAGYTLPYDQVKAVTASDTVPEGIDPHLAQQVRAHDKAINITLNEVNNRAKPLTADFITLLTDRLGDTAPDATALAALIAWYTAQKDVDALILSAGFYIRYLHVAPAGDGRVARLLMNYILLKQDLPPVIVTTDETGEYDAAIQKAHKGDLTPLTDYIAAQMITSLDLSIKAASGRTTDQGNAWKQKLQVLSKDISDN